MQLDIFNDKLNRDYSGVEQALVKMGLHTAVRTMRRVQTAEAEINRLCEIWPERSSILKGGFRYLAPHPAMYDKGQRLYALHCRLMLDRIMKGEALEPGTDAEILASLSNASLFAPLTLEFATAYSRMFHRHLDSLIPEGEEVDIPEYDYEPYPGRCEEIYNDLRNRLSMERDVRAKKLSKN